MTLVLIYWGPAQTGKTTEAMRLAGSDCYIKDSDSIYFDNYRSETTVIIDDFDPARTRIVPAYMNQILEGATHRVCPNDPTVIEGGNFFHKKGGWLRANWNRVIITSQVDPMQWFPRASQEESVMFLSRLTAVIETRVAPSGSESDEETLDEETIFADALYPTTQDDSR